jgi:hypothetical protein
VWQQLATCLLVLEQRSGKEPRQNSRQRREDVNEDGVRTSHMPASSTFEAWWNHTWEERREWWVHKHFDSRSIPVEQEEDGMQPMMISFVYVAGFNNIIYWCVMLYFITAYWCGMMGNGDGQVAGNGLCTKLHA